MKHVLERLADTIRFRSIRTRTRPFTVRSAAAVPRHSAARRSSCFPSGCSALGLSALPLRRCALCPRLSGRSARSSATSRRTAASPARPPPRSSRGASSSSSSTTTGETHQLPPPPPCSPGSAAFAGTLLLSTSPCALGLLVAHQCCLSPSVAGSVWCPTS